MEILKDIFMYVGFAACLLFILLLASAIASWLCEEISHILWTHKYKHRFDKPPKAKCYCVDCKYRVKKSNGGVWCTAHDGFWPVSSYFCADAEPKEKEEIL